MNHLSRRFFVCAVMLGLFPLKAVAQLERLCDPAAEDCRQILINYIRAEKVGLDVGFWFMPWRLAEKENVGNCRAAL